jgi:cobalt-zinc-cadmium resistance protein CzcA
VGITLPIFGKGYRSRNAAAATQVLAQRSNSQYLQTQIQSQLTQYAAQYSFWQNNVNYYRTTALPNAQSIITNATRAYQSGDIGYVEYAQALQLNLEIQRSYLEAINNFNQAVISIQFIINQ